MQPFGVRQNQTVQYNTVNQPQQPIVRSHDSSRSVVNTATVVHGTVNGSGTFAFETNRRNNSETWVRPGVRLQPQQHSLPIQQDLLAPSVTINGGSMHGRVRSFGVRTDSGIRNHTPVPPQDRNKNVSSKNAY